MTPRELVLRFNDAITARDVDQLVAGMTDDHKFIDSEGHTFEGQPRAREIWAGFFAAFPDYVNHFQTVTEAGGRVVATGYSTCSDARLAGPAIWTAEVRDGLVAEWRVYDDTPENRAALSIT